MEHDRALCWAPGKTCECECATCVQLKRLEGDDE